MKVFFTLDTLANAGTEKSTLDMLTHFSKEMDATVVYFYPGDDLKADYEKAGIRLKYAGPRTPTPIARLRVVGKAILVGRYTLFDKTDQSREA